MTQGRYPKAGPVGGRLIREIIRFLRECSDLKLPLSSDILIGVSGGADSVALAHLLVHYGRRVVAREQITLLHVNHRWRARVSDCDERWVKKLGKAWKVPVKSFRLKPPQKTSHEGESWENLARKARKEIFKKQTLAARKLVFTAHQADDLAETLLWRMMTGTGDTHGGAIAVRHGSEIRPLLKIRKKDLKDYLCEVEQGWREDSTNSEGRFLRSKMRQQLMPILENLFPRAVENLGKAALAAQDPSRNRKEEVSPSILLGASGLSARRPHWEWVEKHFAGKKKGEQKQLHLPQGWRLRYERRGTRGEKWVLEKGQKGVSR